MTISIARRAGALAVAVCCLSPGVAFAAFPGGNGRIAYSPSSFGFGNVATIGTIDPDGSNNAYLDVDGSFYDGQPTWSADGSRVVTVDVAGTVAPGSTRTKFTVTGAGGGALGTFKVSGSAYAPSWSPDRTRLAITRRADGSSRDQIAIVDVATGAVTDLAAASSEREPAWSPDGTRIAYTADGSVWTMDTNGGDRRQVSAPGQGADTANWSPDGSQIAYASFSVAGYGISVVGADGSNPRTLVADNYIAYGSPAWAPDGQWIAYDVSDFADGRTDVWKMRPDGSGPSRVVSDGMSPDWQPIVPPPAVTTTPVTGTPAAPVTPATPAAGVQGQTGRSRLSAKSAKRVLKTALRARFKREFQRARKLRIVLRRRSTTRFSGTVSWRTKRYRYSGRVSVRLTDVGAKPSVGNVKRARHTSKR